MAKAPSIDSLEEELKNAKGDLKQCKKELTAAKRVQKQAEQKKYKVNTRSRKPKPVKGLKKLQNEVKKKEEKFDDAMLAVKRLEGAIKRKKSTENRKKANAPVKFLIFQGIY